MALLNEGDTETAPRYAIPARRLGALEHPMLVKDVDKAIQTFGMNPSLQVILDSESPQISVPLYLRPDNPTARPLTSHNALTHNVVLKITVPKRTGRKRRRGTNAPFEGEVDAEPDAPGGPQNEIRSASKIDDPKVLRRKLCDNVGKYTVEPIGIIRNTHRYRGLADFQYAMGNSGFMDRLVNKVLPGDLEKLKEFSLQPGIESGSNIDLIPPPNFTPMALPFQYGYNQNPYTKEVAPGGSSPSGSMADDDEYGRVVNVTLRIPAAGYFIAHDEYPIPTRPSREPNMSDPQVALIISEMRLAMEERPIWTRRSMWNRLGHKFASLPKSGSLVKHCLQYAGYQFKGGPWRDALVKYGVDPRSDPKYRIYQTLIFKLNKTRLGSVGRSWQAVRRVEAGISNFGQYWKELGSEDSSLETHIFNGKAFSTDGKVWQVCDITDPLLASLFANAEVRPECDNEVSGYYHRVLWSVAKAIMKCKMLAVRFGRTLTDEDFTATLSAVKGPNDGGDGGSGTSIGISLPDLQLTREECEQLRGKSKPGVRGSRDRWKDKRRRTHYRVRIPLKETEARQAEKMINMLSSAPGGSSRNQRADGDASTSHGDEEGEGRAPGDMSRLEEGDEEGDEDDDQDEGAFQDLLDDLEEGDDSDDDNSDEEEEDMEGEENEEDADEDADKNTDEYDSDDRGTKQPAFVVRQPAPSDDDEEEDEDEIQDYEEGDYQEGDYDEGDYDGVGDYDDGY